MKWYPGPEGDQRIYYEPEEIEQIMADELARAGLTPTPSNPVTNLDRFIEFHLKVKIDHYADLPEGVLGLTQFSAGQPPEMFINARLTEAAEVDSPQPGKLGRWRATLAHEATHVLLHRYLFDPELNQPTLFSAKEEERPEGARLMRCLKRDVGFASSTKDWREVQANRGMAALLMPRALFRRIALRSISAQELTDLEPGSPSAELLAADLAATFNVSKQAATIRLETTKVLGSNGTALPGL